MCVRSPFLGYGIVRWIHSYRALRLLAHALYIYIYIVYRVSKRTVFHIYPYPLHRDRERERAVLCMAERRVWKSRRAGGAEKRKLNATPMMKQPKHTQKKATAGIRDVKIKIGSFATFQRKIYRTNGFLLLFFYSKLNRKVLQLSRTMATEKKPELLVFPKRQLDSIQFWCCIWRLETFAICAVLVTLTAHNSQSRILKEFHIHRILVYRSIRWMACYSRGYCLIKWSVWRNILFHVNKTNGIGCRFEGPPLTCHESRLSNFAPPSKGLKPILSSCQWKL